MHTGFSHNDQEFLRSLGRATFLVGVSLLLFVGTCGLCFYVSSRPTPVIGPPAQPAALLANSRHDISDLWQAPDSTTIPVTSEGDLIRYGRELISHTAKYLGPRGSVRRMSNGMNCQNCHLRAGTKPFGNSYAAVVSTYPRFRARSGGIETIEKRINDCVARSLNGGQLDENSLEMRAIIAWFDWLGQNVKRGEVPKGSGIPQLPVLNRAADPVKGLSVYNKHCKLCHGVKAEGARHADSIEWKYPPLAGMHSYNTAAGLYRLSRFAGYVKNNMPHGTTFENPVLTDEEAWDVAAYINSLPRPEKYFAEDWPDIKAKPFDHPFGPYADSFSEQQHKYGPYSAILDYTSKQTPGRH